MIRMAFFSRLGIRGKLILGVALVHLIMMTVFVMDLVQRQRAFLLQAASASALKQASLIAAAASSWVLADDIAGIEEILQTSQSNSPLRYVLVSDLKGLVLAHTDNDLVGKYLSDPISLKALRESGGAMVWHTDRHAIHVRAPIMVSDRNIGWVFLSLDTTPTTAHLNYVSRNGFIYTIVAIVAGTIFAWLLSRFILRQLKMLLAGVDRLRADQLDEPIPIISNDEIGWVGKALNLAMKALRQNRSEIQKEVTERRIAEQEIRCLSQRLIGSSEEERRRIGHDLHDELGQMITSVQFGLQSISGLLQYDTGQAAQLCGKLAEQAEEMGEAIHRIASDLWPATLEHMGLVVAVRAYLDEVSNLLPRLRISFSTQNMSERLDPCIDLICFRITQEAFNNIIRHSKARNVAVTLSTNGGCLKMHIQDDGIGFEMPGDYCSPSLQGAAGIGLFGMRERAASVGGKLNIKSALGQGCIILAQIPFEPRG